jgi:nucleotide-binding universal stress UspA family protein
LKDVLKIAKKTHAKVKCLYVKKENSDVSEATIKQWKEEFEGEPIEFVIIYNEDVQDAILDFILVKDIDVLAMLTYKRNFFVELFNPSLTQKFSNQSSIPILAMHE